MKRHEYKTLESLVVAIHTLIALITPYLYYALLVDTTISPMVKLIIYLITLRMWSSDITCPLTHLQNYLRVKAGQKPITSFPSYLLKDVVPTVTTFPSYLLKSLQTYTSSSCTFLKNTADKLREIYKSNREARRELEKGSPLYWYGKRQNTHSEALKTEKKGILESLTTYILNDMIEID